MIVLLESIEKAVHIIPRFHEQNQYLVNRYIFNSILKYLFLFFDINFIWIIKIKKYFYFKIQIAHFNKLGKSHAL